MSSPPTETAAPRRRDAPPATEYRDFDRRLLPPLRALPCFREATAIEIDAPFDAYRGGDFARLVEVWEAVATPTRARLAGLPGLAYREMRRLPRSLARAGFLASLRAVLAAGRTFFDQQLRPATASAIRARFAWLERRHEHVPPGFTPELRFPDGFRAWVDDDSADDALARFQLAAALNEVQQYACSRDLATRFGLPELRRHAEREREMALAYLARYAPAATRESFRQCILVLDALNAAVFAVTARSSFPFALLIHARRADEEWRRFTAGLAEPLAMPPPEAGTAP